MSNLTYGKHLSPYPFWERDATDDQILQSTAVKHNESKAIHEGSYDRMTNVQFMEYASNIHELTRDDRMVLYKAFRIHLEDKQKSVNKPEKYICGCTHIVHGDCYVIEELPEDMMIIQDLSGNQHTVHRMHSDH